MPNHLRIIWRLRALVTIAVLSFPVQALANAFWPPALYFYGASAWWAVPSGLAAEYAILYPFLRVTPLRLLQIVVIANAASAFVGFLVTWPVVFWETGVDAILIGEGFFLPVLLLVIIAIFVLNVAIEYWVSIKWLGILRRRVTLMGFICANAVSFVILFTAGLSMLKL